MSIEESDYRRMMVPPLTEEELSTFMESLGETPVKGMCFSPQRIEVESIAEDIEGVSPDPEMPGYATYPYGTFLSSEPLYLAGAIYPMDRSAYRVSWLLSRCLEGVESPWICDLCAAPGGKSIALSTLVRPGFILCNDIDRRRAGILRTNIERAGIPDSAVTCLSPEALLPKAKESFDAVILDAPCSGSGMSRKDSSVEKDWSPEKVERCSLIQRGLIDITGQLVRPGGYLCYSTCSYSREEDEDIMEEFMDKHPEFSILKLDVENGISGIEDIGIRFIPGFHEGEGQYCCILKKEGASERKDCPVTRTISVDGISLPAVRYREADHIVSRCPDWLSSLSPLKIGFRVQGDPKNSLCDYDWSLSKCADVPFEHLELSREQALSYFRGQDLRDASLLKGTRGIVIPSYRGFSLGFGDRQERRIRNLLPKGLRIGN